MLLVVRIASSRAFAEAALIWSLTEVTKSRDEAWEREAKQKRQAAAAAVARAAAVSGGGERNGAAASKCSEWLPPPLSEGTKLRWWG